MSDITLSKSIRNNLRSLQGTAELLGRTQDRLATGKKVNSALDNPSNFFTASALSSRAGDLGNLLDSVSNSVQTLKAADNGIKAINRLVDSAKATARQALQTAGPVTENKAAGLATATVNPTGKASFSGTGDTVTAADATATVSLGAVASDLANIADVSTGDLDTGAADGLGLLSDTAGDGPDLVNGDSVSLKVNGVDYTLNFDASTAAGGARAGDATNGYTLTLGVDQTLASLDDAFNTLLADSGVTVAGTDNLTFSFSSDVNTAVLSDGQSGATLTKLGLNSAGDDFTGSGSSLTGDRLLTKAQDAELKTAIQNNASISVQLGTGTTTTVNFGVGSSDVSTRAGLVSALQANTSLAIGDTGAGNAITITNADSGDFDTEINLDFDPSGADSTAGKAAAKALFTGLSGSLYEDNGNGNDTGVIKPSNLLNNSDVGAGDTLSITVGSESRTITFGTDDGANQVSSLKDLNRELSKFTRASASVGTSGGTLGQLKVTANSAEDTIKITGSTGLPAKFGFTDNQEISNLLNSTDSSGTVNAPLRSGEKLTLQVGTNEALEITFGTGTGQVNTVDELKDKLTELAGGTASLDSNTGAITITATDADDEINVTGSGGADAARNVAVATAFGLAQGTDQDAGTSATYNYKKATTDNSTRASLEKDFNQIIDQITELAEDASYNGVNLLQGDDLSVIFNEDGSSKLEIKGVDFSATGLGLSKAVAGNFQSDDELNSALDSIDTATNTLRSQASKFGSNLSIVQTRQDFTKDIINTLQTGADNLTLADLNEEAANVLALQTRQQLGTSALSLSSQSEQGVLRLF